MCGLIEKILRRGGVDRRIMGRFYDAVAQAVLLFESEMWKLPPGWRSLLKVYKMGRYS